MPDGPNSQTFPSIEEATRLMEEMGKKPDFERASDFNFPPDSRQYGRVPDYAFPVNPPLEPWKNKTPAAPAVVVQESASPAPEQTRTANALPPVIDMAVAVKLGKKYLHELRDEGRVQVNPALLRQKFAADTSPEAIGNIGTSNAKKVIAALYEEDALGPSTRREHHRILVPITAEPPVAVVAQESIFPVQSQQSRPAYTPPVVDRYEPRFVEPEQPGAPAASDASGHKDLSLYERSVAKVRELQKDPSYSASGLSAKELAMHVNMNNSGEKLDVSKAAEFLDEMSKNKIIGALNPLGMPENPLYSMTPETQAPVAQHGPAVVPNQPSKIDPAHVQIAREYVEGPKNGKAFAISDLRKHLNKNGVVVDDAGAHEILSHVDGIEHKDGKYRENPKHHQDRMAAQIANITNPLDPSQVGGPAPVNPSTSTGVPPPPPPSNNGSVPPGWGLHQGRRPGPSQDSSVLPDAYDDDAGGHQGLAANNRGGAGNNPYANLGQQQAEQAAQAAKKLKTDSDYYKGWVMKTLGLTEGVHDHHVKAYGGPDGYMKVQLMGGGHVEISSSRIRHKGLGKKIPNSYFIAATVLSVEKFHGKVSVKGNSKAYKMHSLAAAIAYERSHPGKLHLTGTKMTDFSKRERALILKEASEISFAGMSSFKEHKLIKMQNQTAELEYENALAERAARNKVTVMPRRTDIRNEPAA